MKVNLQDTKVGAFDFEFLRGLSNMRTGGVELGECLETISSVNNGSDPCIIRFLQSHMVTETIGGARVACDSNSKLDKVLRQTLGPR
jgi:hypothetical protein